MTTMPVTFNTTQIKYKDQQGNYIGINGVAERTTDEQIAEIQAAAEAAKETIPPEIDEVWQTIEDMNDNFVKVSETAPHEQVNRIWVKENPDEVMVPTDAELDNVVESIAPDYADLTYPVAAGTLCTHSRALYKAKVDIDSAEEWDSTKWDAVDVADEIGRVDSVANSLVKHTNWINSVNLYNVDDPDQLAGYIAYDGFHESSSGYVVSHLIYVYSGYTYKFHHSSHMGGSNYIGLYDDKGKLVGVQSGSINDNYVTFTSNRNGFVRVNTDRSSEFMVCIESMYPNIFTRYQLEINDNIELNIHDVEEKDTTFLHNIVSVNLFNKNSDKLLSGYIAWNGFVETTGSSYYVTHPIYVESGKTYKLQHSSNLGSSCKAGYTDKDGLTTVSSTITGVIEDGYEYYTITNSGYVRFNIGYLDINTFMICNSNDYPETYVPYINAWKMPSLMVDNDQILGNDSNILYGKSITFNGDSICAGAGSSGGYGKIIADNNNMIYQNIGVGGGTITSGTTSGSTPRHHICDTIQNMNSDADYAIIEGGVNDASLMSQAPLGSISTGYDAVLDTNTFIGAMEYCCKQLITRFKGKKVGYIAVHKMTDHYNSDNTENSYYHAAINVCKKWGVPVCDLNISCPPFGYLVPSKCTDTNLNQLPDLYTKEDTETHHGDGWHPNKLGYEKYYVPVIEAWLKTL